METILHRFYANASVTPRAVCFLVKDKGTGLWKETSWGEVLDQVHRLARALLSLGVVRGTSIAILSQTRYEWTVIDLAILSIGCETVPIYNTLSNDQVAFILNHSQSKVVFIEDLDHLEKYRTIASAVTSVGKGILIEGRDPKGKFLSLYDLLGRESVREPRLYFELISGIRMEDVATCVYTSGTTGEPKGVPVTHANIIGEIEGLNHVFNFGRSDIGLLFLPLAHVMARAMQFHQLANGYVTAYAESVARLKENILEVRPYFMLVVPRMLEKIAEAVDKKIQSAPLIMRLLLNKSVRLGRRVSQALRTHRSLPLVMRAKYFFVKNVIFSKIRRGMGGRLRVIVSGGAPLDAFVAEFFHAIGISVVEGYGLTETMAAITLNHLDDFKFGTVGKPLEGVEVRIADDGEVLVKGSQVFHGYRPPLTNGAGTSFEEGWFKTGDFGEFSREGFLRITGRKKELIITSSGKNISPQRVENVIKESPYIKDVVVFGDHRKYLTALVVLDEEAVGLHAKERGFSFSKGSEIVKEPHLYDLIRSEIELRNQNLARFETIKKFVILGREFSQEGGELTPTLKVRRQKVFEKYKDIIEDMYLNPS